MISVIIPVYNVEKYLEKCVYSVINQTYKHLEIILVDDGSKDRSGNICEELKSKDNRIKVIHKENQGLGLARNSGIEIATGEYVTFIDSDDYVSNNLIEDLYKGIIENNVDTVIGGFKRVNENDEVIEEKKFNVQKYYQKDVLEIFLPKLIGSMPRESDGIKMSVWNAIYKRETIAKNNIKFPSEREFISEDIIFALEYYKHSKGVCILNNSNYYYRTNMNSLTQSYREDRFEATKKLYNEELKKIKELNIYEQAKIRLDKQLYIYIKKCITQENIKVSKKTKKNAIENIKKICCDKEVQEVIKNYPISKLGIQQKIFVYLIKYNMASILYLLLCKKG